MTSRILKYLLVPADEYGVTEVEIPASASIKHIDLQISSYGVGVMAWAEVITDDYKDKRRFTLIPTGAEVPDNGTYMKTVQFPSGTVWHLYEIKK